MGKLSHFLKNKILTPRFFFPFPFIIYVKLNVTPSRDFQYQNEHFAKVVLNLQIAYVTKVHLQISYLKSVTIFTVTNSGQVPHVRSENHCHKSSSATVQLLVYFTDTMIKCTGFHSLVFPKQHEIS